MEGANGYPKKTRRPNGKANGKPAKEKFNGHAAAPALVSPQQQKQLLALKKRSWRSGWLPWLLNTAARLLSWFVIYTIIFRCPTDLDSCTETSPAICAPYFQLKSTVAPHVSPIYETYAKPYVEAARPYYDTVNTRFLTPTFDYASRHAGPRFEQAKEIGVYHWEKSVQPQLDRYQDRAHVWYDDTIAPHVQKAQMAAEPYIELSKTNALRTYHEAILPAYTFAHPYALSGYGLCAGFATNTVVPTATWTWIRVHTFLDGTVWPHLRVLYMENVEPQLVRIGERLGRNRYDRAGQTLSPTGSTFSTTTPHLVTPSSAPSLVATSEPQTIPSAASVEPSASSGAPETKGTTTAKSTQDEDDDDDDFTKDTRPIKVIVADDLEKWESRYTQAAEDGVKVIIERVDEITERMVADEIKMHGDRLLAQLKDTVEAELDKLRTEIPKLAANAVDEEQGRANISAAVRKSGLAIKEKAQGLRTWREQFTAKLQDRVNKAAHSNVQILEEIRDLALQKIGMKWAWMDGVTYKDWQKFHDLRSRLTGWTQEVKDLVVTHPGIEDAQIAASEIEDAAMEVAQAAAKELTTLKRAGLLKVTAGDASESLDPSIMEAAALENFSTDDEAATAGENDIIVDGEGLSDTVPMVETRTETATVVVSLKKAKHDADEIPEDAEPEDEAHTVDGINTETADSHQNIGNAKPTDDTLEPPPLAQERSEAIIGAGPAVLDTISEAKAPESILLQEEDGLPETDERIERNSYEEDIKPAFFGAAAQSVADNQPILDDESDASAGLTDIAQAAYSTAVAQAAAQYSTAVSIASAMMYGASTPKPVHERLFSDVSSSYTAAVAAASSQLSAALGAASNSVHSTSTTAGLMPTVDWARVEAIAVHNLNEGRAWAEMQYSSAKIAMGLATATPTAPVDKLLGQAKYNYYAGLGVAQARYHEFLAAIASAASSMTATPTPTGLAGTASSLASTASESAVSVASAAGQGAAAAASGASALVSAAGDSINSAIADVEAQAADAVSAITDAWEVVVDQISMQVYSEPTRLSWYEQAYEGALPYAIAATDKVVEGVSAVTEAAVAAPEQAARQYPAVSSLISELIVGKEPTFSESVMSRLMEAYSTASSKVGDAASRATAVVKQEKDEL